MGRETRRKVNRRWVECVSLRARRRVSVHTVASTAGAMTLRRSVALVATILCGLAGKLAAQGTAEVIRGRVTSDSGKPLVATVIVTRGPDRLVKNSTTDS